MSSLSIYAGPTALQQIRREGLKADQFKVLVGASGGPKWFVLYGLDRYLFGEFCQRREQQLITLGSSAGAWRLCCLAYWQEVPKLIADVFAHIVDTGNGIDNILRFEDRER